MSNIIHDSFTLERTFTKSIADVFDILASPAERKKWLGAGEHHTVEFFETDFRTNGLENMLYRFNEGTPFPGVELRYVNQFLDVVEDSRIVVSSRMSFGGVLVSISQETFELQPEGNGSKLIFTNQTAYFEGADGPQIRKQGWTTLLDRLHEIIG